MGFGSSDAFVARLNASLTTLRQATYLGGPITGPEEGDDIAYALAIHPMSGEVYVAGFTNSMNFPATTGGAQMTPNPGAPGAFVARLAADLTTLKQATYLGGRFRDEVFALAIHPMSGEVYVTGYTQSVDFPGTTGGAQPAGAQPVPTGCGCPVCSCPQAFVAHLNAGLTMLGQATYLGTSVDIAHALAIHPMSGEVYVAGYTNSTNFPGTTGGAQPAYGGGGDAFVARLTSDLTVLDQATYLGGSSSEVGNALAIHPTSGEVYVAGGTYSTDLPGSYSGAQGAARGDSDAFAARLTSDLSGPVVVKPTTTIALAPATPDGSNGWYVSNVHATVTATDAGGSGVAEMRCVLDPTSPPAIFGDIPAGCAFTGAGADVSSEGVHVLYAASKDVAGNVETPVSAAFQIDRTAPTVTCELTPVFLVGSGGGSISASVADATSGPTVSPISAAVTAGDVAAAGMKSKSLTGLDNAGNSTTVACAYVVEFVTAGAVFNCAAGDVPCLIASIDAANANPDANTINLAASTYTLTAANNAEGGNTNGLPIISSAITIRGVGAEATIIERDPLPTSPSFRILQVAVSGIFTLESLTIRNGISGGSGGGGIYNGGTTTIVNSVIANNVDYRGDGGGGIRNDNTLVLTGSRVEGNSTDESDGGGIQNGGTLTVDHSSISGNNAFEFGGGIRNGGTATITYSTIAGNGTQFAGGILSTGTTTIKNSTIVGNYAFDPSAGSGGIYDWGSNTTVENSTITGNSSRGSDQAAGGIFHGNGGSLLINNSTIVDNSIERFKGNQGGGGLLIDGGTVQLQNTILARNEASGFDYEGQPIAGPPDCAGEVTSLGHNLVGDPSGCGITLLASDHTGDPGLNSFQDDGTPGNGHFPLLETSQGLDAGDPASCILTDQLGHSRIDGDGDGIVVCDIGAIEFSPAATIVSDLASLAQVVTASKRTPVPGGPAGTFTITATFTNTSSIFHT